MKNPYESPKPAESVARRKICWTRARHFMVAITIFLFGLLLVVSGHSLYVGSKQPNGAWLAPIVLAMDCVGYAGVAIGFVLIFHAFSLTR